MDHHHQHRSPPPSRFPQELRKIENSKMMPGNEKVINPRVDVMTAIRPGCIAEICKMKSVCQPKRELPISVCWCVCAPIWRRVLCSKMEKSKQKARITNNMITFSWSKHSTQKDERWTGITIWPPTQKPLLLPSPTMQGQIARSHLPSRGRLTTSRRVYNNTQGVKSHSQAGSG